MGKKISRKKTGADIPENVTLAEVLAEVRRGFADVVYAIGKLGKAIADVDTRLESVRKVMFYIPDVARGVDAAKAKRAAKVAAENGGAATVTPSAESSAGAGAAHAGVVNVAALPQLIAPENESGVRA